MAEEAREYPEPHFSTREFKLEAGRLRERREQTVAQIARDLGMPERVLYRWRHELREQPEQAVPGTGHHSALEQENRRLQHELELLTPAREILKQALGIVSRGPLCSPPASPAKPARAPSRPGVRPGTYRGAAIMPGVTARLAVVRRPTRR
jgi:transposase